MHKILPILLCLSSLVAVPVFAQMEKSYIKDRINHLSSDKMQGRGYAGGGNAKAATYLKKNFQESGLLFFDGAKGYNQRYSFPVNTFPGEVSLQLNGKELKPGVDFLVHAASRAYHGENIKLENIDLKNVKDSTAWKNVKSRFEPGRAYLLEHADTPEKYVKLSLRSFATELPGNLFIIPKHGKLTWLACTDTVAGTILIVEDTVMPAKTKTATVKIDTRYIPKYHTQNLIGYVKGTEHPDSFIVFSAHYDHLGKMGRETIFPGAHDNASGTSLVLYLSDYFAKHPPEYSVAFMLFSGEEAGLMGSEHYVKNPVFPLKNIRFVINLDMTGEATNGITVVNAIAREKEFAMLEKINAEKKYLPEIKKRDQTKNSDHYSFSEAGVPAIFIYTNGTKPFYHDVFDVAEEISLDKVDNLAKMLIEFTGELSNSK